VTTATDQLAVLRALRLKGRATTEDLTVATGLDTGPVQATVQALLVAEHAREMRGAYLLTPAGRADLEELLTQERGTVDTAAIAALYEQFTAVNHDFKVLATDWQLRGSEPNDHGDAPYDQSVLDRLPGIDERVQPIARALGEQAPRLKPYATRLSNALQHVKSGRHEWLLKPLIDSYHTVWFELHEELISLAGLTRLGEAAAGRAH
jgi:hypothetical protein